MEDKIIAAIATVLVGYALAVLYGWKALSQKAEQAASDSQKNAKDIAEINKEITRLAELIRSASIVADNQSQSILDWREEERRLSEQRHEDIMRRIGNIESQLKSK